MTEPLIIRSYRRVFQVDRRIYRVDRWALPVPGGVPLRGFVYFAATLGAVLVLGSLPVVGKLLGELSPPLRYVVVPLAVAVLGTHAAPDGRPAHSFAWSWLALRLRSRRRSAGRRVPLEGAPVPWAGVLGVRWDTSSAVPRRGRVHGPARATFRHGVKLRDRPRGPIVALVDDGAAAGPVVVCGREVLEVRP